MCIRDSADDDIEAADLYARAGKLAEESAASPAPSAATSALMADELVVDIKLGVAQLALREAAPVTRRRVNKKKAAEAEAEAKAEARAEAKAKAEAAEEEQQREGEKKKNGKGDGKGKNGGVDALVAAEAAIAEAVTAAESLGYGEHPRVGIAVACSGDVYVAKAARAAIGAGQGRATILHMQTV